MCIEIWIEMMPCAWGAKYNITKCTQLNTKCHAHVGIV